VSRQWLLEETLRPLEHIQVDLGRNWSRRAPHTLRDLRGAALLHSWQPRDHLSVDLGLTWVLWQAVKKLVLEFVLRGVPEMQEQRVVVTFEK